MIKNKKFAAFFCIPVAILTTSFVQFWIATDDVVPCYQSSHTYKGIICLFAAAMASMVLWIWSDVSGR